MKSFWGLVHDALNNPVLVLPQPKRSFEPSGAGFSREVEKGLTIRSGGCNRRNVYSHLNYPGQEGDDTIESYWKRTAGTLFTQQVLRGILEPAWLLIAAEARISNMRVTPKGRTYTFAGRIDLIVRDPETNRPLFVECKQKGDYSWATDGIINSKAATKETAAKPLFPSLDDVAQPMIYLDWAREKLGVEDPEMLLIYFTRGGGQHSEHLLTLGPNDCLVVENSEGVTRRDDVTLGMIYEDADRTMDQVAEGIIPDRPYSPQWSEQRIMWEYRNRTLGKGDHQTVAASLEKGKATLEKGDWPCGYCPFSWGCLQEHPPADFKPGPLKAASLSLIGGAEPQEPTYHTEPSTE